jgi:OOP family OmpA-OmpF porin
MRVTRLFVASFAFTIFAASATGQQAPAPTRSVDDYVCAFAGECSKQPNADNSIAAPSTRGFRLSVPERHATPDAAQARSPGANGASATSRTAVGSRSASTRPQVASRRGNAGRRAVAAQQRRMDLRVSFLLGSAQLTDQAREEAKVFATALQLPELASKRFRIEGHTDSSGSRALNLDLSKRRAQAVADYLASLGVNSARLEVRGYGPDKPLARHSASSPENRRVEAELL